MLFESVDLDLKQLDKSEMESRRDKEMENIKATFANDNDDLSFSSYVDYYGHNFDDLKDIDVFTCDNFKYQFSYFFLIQHFMQNPFEKDKIGFMNEGKLRMTYFEFDTLKKLAFNNNHIKEIKGIDTVSMYKNKEIQDVLAKYGLKKSGVKKVLVDRIIENLSEDEINKEFPKIAIDVTDEGIRYYRKFWYFWYFIYLRIEVDRDREYWDYFYDDFNEYMKINSDFSQEEILLNTFENYCLHDIEKEDSFLLIKDLYDIHMLHRFRKNMQKAVEYAIVHNAILDAAKKSPNIRNHKYKTSRPISEKSFKNHLDMSDEEYLSYRESVLNDLSQYIDIKDMDNWER